MPSSSCFRIAVGAVLGIALLSRTQLGYGQQSSTAQPNPSPPVSLAPYRPPALALVQPAAGGSVPHDRPIVVFRFAAGEPNDAIDARSFTVAVDREDRTALFQVSASEAWGPLTPSHTSSAQPITRTRQIAARICSARGTCSEVAATVTVAPSATSGEKPADERRRTVIDVLLDAARKLLRP